MQCRSPVADLMSEPGGTRSAQLIYGDQFLVLEKREGLAFGRMVRDGYCGYVAMEDLGSASAPTHWVCAAQSHLYPRPDMKQLHCDTIYFGAEVSVLDIDGDWARLEGGSYLPRGHILPLVTRLNDPVAVAEFFLGSPYLWGGNSRSGIDCSGLVQMSLRGCGFECPRDSDMQEVQLGQPAQGPLQRGDLVFWKGHVGILTAPDQLLHANAYHMAVTYEPFEQVCQRIEQARGGPVTSIRRI